MNSQELIKSLGKEKEQFKILRPHLYFFLWLGVAFFTSFLCLSYLGIRSDISSALLSIEYIIEIFPLVALAVYSAYLALIESIPGRKSNLGGVSILLTMSLAYLFIMFTTELVVDFRSAFQIFWVTGLNCLGGIIFTSVPSTLTLLYFCRKMAPTQLRLVAGLCSVSGASLGVLAVNIYCGIDQAFHHILWGLIPFTLLVILGITQGKHLLRW